jgi:prolipoprotein diacylglyceryl transferase
VLPVLTWSVDREIVGFGVFALRWYSLLFALGFAIGYLMIQRFFRVEGKPEKLLDPLLLHLVIGTVVGARLGHCLFYEPEDYLTNPLRILYIWEGGLASHGGFLGVMIAMWLFARKHAETPFFWLADRVTIPTMIEAACIRIGNLFNSEILGKPADVPWAVVFSRHDAIPRHPTQVYEALGYLSVWAVTHACYRLSGRKPPEGRIVGLALTLGYAFRTWVETFKENQVDFEQGMWLNMGQLLSLPFILIGLALIFGWHRKLPFFQSPVWLSDCEPTTPQAGGSGLDVAPMTAAGRRGQLRRQTRKLKK